MSGSNPVTDVAKSRRGSDNDTIELADGKRGRIVAVSATLISDVTRGVKDPPVPVIHDLDKDQHIPNPHDPAYLQALEDVKSARGIAAMDAMLMFGLELLDGLPDDDKWIRQLRALEKRGLVDLSTFDMEDEIDKEFLYKRYIAANTDVLTEITKRTGLSEEVIQEAEESF